MKNKQSAYRELFGRNVPDALTTPINKWEIQKANPAASGKSLIEEETAKRQALLCEFLGVPQGDFQALAIAVFDGLKVIEGGDPRYKHDEVLQILALKATGFKDEPAAKEIAKRGGGERESQTIKRDYQATATYKMVRGKHLDAGHVALVQSGLLDQITELGRAHADVLVYYPEVNAEDGLPLEIGPFQSSIAIAFAQGTGQQTLTSTRALSPKAVQEIVDEATHGVVVIDRPGGNAGEHLRAGLEAIGVANVPILFAIDELSEMHTPSVIVIDPTIPATVLDKVNEFLKQAPSRQGNAFVGGVTAQKS